LGGVAGGRTTAPGGGATLVAEADESDGTLALYSPALLVLCNLDLDHVDRFASTEEFEGVFRTAISRTRGPLVYCADHPRAAVVAESSGHSPRVSFGFSANADWRIEDWSPEQDGGQRFGVRFPGAPSPVECTLPVPGRHNALNAVAALAAAAQCGLSPALAAEALARHATLPARRFERTGKPDGFTVVSDYAHHPSEIAALVATARGVRHQRIVAVFQPHRYTRTRTFLRDFPKAFAGVDDLVLCPVYAASEDPVPGGTSVDLYAAFRETAFREGAAAEDGRRIPTPVLADSLDSAFSYVASTVLRGDLVLVVGAGNVDSLAPRIAALEPNDAEPPRPAISAFGTKAPVPRFRVVDSTAGLFAAIREARDAGETPAVVGAGTNTLVAATGCRRPVLRLRGEYFSFVEPCSSGETDGTAVIEAGAAWPGQHLLDYCRSLGLSGLEFMAGIPGLVGGWLAMNAGTRAGAFCDAVESVRAVRVADGAETRLSRADLAPAYRSCPGLAGSVAVSVRLRLREADPA
ncbi:MAG: FAD-binding protein, partial [Kiritimatiellae bacterium]|nr:FAD-binding protein [Kiritimatiellia bacterium]